MKNLTVEEKLSILEKKIDALLNESVEDNLIKERKTMDSMGRITIPKTYRKMLGIEKSSADFLVSIKGKEIILKICNDSDNN